jgi:hypothetical protein
MSNHQELNNLSFVSSEALSQNLSYALSSVGQKLGHQKHQEMVARLQGFESLNHRPNHSGWAKSVTLLVTDVQNSTGVDMVSLEVSYLRVTFTREHLEKMIQATAAVKSIDKWGTMALKACRVDAYEEISDVDWLEDASAEDILKSLDRQEEDNESLVNVQGIQVHVSPAIRDEFWISGYEKHGFHFETSLLSIKQLVEVFENGVLDGPEDWRVLDVQR